jgi:hypothetical protein
MKGLLIKDPTHWRDAWSAHIATHMAICDSTYNLLIFDDRHSAEEITAQIAEAPERVFQIIDLEEAAEHCCDFVSDAGRYYRRV